MRAVVERAMEYVSETARVTTREDLKRPSIEAALTKAMTSMSPPSARSSAALDVASAWATALACEFAWPGVREAGLGRGIWAGVLGAGAMRLIAGWDLYASRAHALVDVNALAAAAVDAVMRARGQTPFAFVRSMIRLALLVRACATSALWSSNGFFRSSEFKPESGIRGVFHRLEHAGAINIAVCVSIAVVSLGPTTGAQHHIGATLLENALGLRVEDSDTIEHVEQLCAAVLTTVLFNALLNATRRRLLGRPLQGIIETLEYHAKQVFTDLEIQANEIQSMDISVLGYVLDKMSHIVKRNESDNGSSALIEAILEDHDDVDGSTREWLVSYNASTIKSTAASAMPKSQVNTFKSFISSFARMSDASGPYMSVDIVALNSWSFDVFEVSDSISCIMRMFHELNMFELVDPFKLRRFLSEVESMYRDNPYHCFKHAFDVAHTTYLYILAVKDQVEMSQLEIFSLLVAALVHDLDHPGVTNAYLIATRDSIAMTYNDESVLENLHLSRFFTLCQNNEDANILSAFDEDTYSVVRRTIIGCVLHTDMAHHFKLVSRMNEMVSLGRKTEIIRSPIGSPMSSPIKSCVVLDREGDPSVAVSFKTDEERQLMLNVLLHCADISNAVKPNELCVKWASRVLEEFFNQGDRERAKGMSVSPMMDRETTSVGLSQINFIEFVIAPLYVQFAAIFPAVSHLLDRLIENRRYYQETYERELAESTEIDGVERSSAKESLRMRFRTLIEKHGLHAQAAKFDDELTRAILSLPFGTPGRRTSGNRQQGSMLSSPSTKSKAARQLAV